VPIVVESKVADWLLPLTLSAQLAAGNKAIAVTIDAKILAEFMFLLRVF
jgi:Flp pilus assembly protein CpaB